MKTASQQFLLQVPRRSLSTSRLGEEMSAKCMSQLCNRQALTCFFTGRLIYRPNPSTVNNYPFKMSDDSNRKSDQRINNFSTIPTASTSGSNLSHETHITDLNEIKTSIKQLIEAQQQQQRSIEETRKVILQHMLSSKEELSTLQRVISQLHTNDDQTSKAIDDANLRVLADEVKSMNANHRESIVSMKVCWPHYLREYVWVP